MTNIEKIKQARKELDGILTELGQKVGRRQRIYRLQLEVIRVMINDLSYAQAEALRQATEVADENFARAQKLSEQVQENVRHIERLAGERGEVFTAVVDALDGMITSYEYEASQENPALLAARAALALAKGESV